jgi:hypothetical protein
VVHIRGIKHPDLQAKALRQWLRKYWFPYIIIVWFVANVILNFQRSKCFRGRDSSSQVQEWCQYGPSVYSYFGCVNYAYERWLMRHLFLPFNWGDIAGHECKVWDYMDALEILLLLSCC